MGRPRLATAILATIVLASVASALGAPSATADPREEDGAALDAARREAERLVSEGRAEQAADAYGALADRALSVGRPDWAEYALEQRIACLFPLRRHEDVRLACERLIEVQLRRGDVTGAHRTRVNLACVLVDGGRYDAGIALLREAVAGLGDVDPRATAHARTTLAIALAARGRFAEALEAVERARESAAASGDEGVAEYADVIEASLLSDVGEYERSLAVLSGLLARVPEEAGRRRAEVLANAALGLGMLGRDEEALARYAQALDLAAKAGHDHLRASALLGRAELHRQAGRHGEALADCREAHRLAGDDPLLRGFARTGIGNALLHRTPPDLAGAAEAYDEALSLAAEIGSLDLRLDAHVGRAGLRLRQGDLGQARHEADAALDTLDLLDAGLAQTEAAFARAHRAVATEVALRVALADPRPELLFRMLERVRAHVLARAIGRGTVLRGQGLDARSRAAEQAARDRLLRAQAACQQAHATGRRLEIRRAAEAWRAAHEEYRATLQRLERGTAPARQLQRIRPVTLAEAQAGLGADEVLALYVMPRPRRGAPPARAGALLVEADAARWVDLGEAAPIRKASAELAEVWTSARDPLPTGKRLARLLLEPLRLPDRVRLLRIVPDAPLTHLPFAWLSRAGDPAGPGLEVVFVPSATVDALLRGEERPRGRRLLAVGDCDYGTGGAGLRLYGGRPLPPLPASRREIEAVVRPGDVVLLGRDASETRLCRELRSAGRWRAIHLACHGLLDTRSPTLSALALVPTDEDDGFLTAAEIARLEVETDLVVLSACRTGLGREVASEGMLGLVRAFMAAGAPRVLASLWDVDDDATALLMQHFHRALDAPGVSATTALAEAQAAVAGAPGSRFHGPRYWAGWVLWGIDTMPPPTGAPAGAPESR